MDSMTIHYIFNFNTDKQKKYEVKVDQKTMRIIPPSTKEYPEWTKLEFSKCDHCPYESKNVNYCPIAANLSDALEDFKDDFSYSETSVGVITKDRTFLKRTSIQSGLQGLMGLIMATSDCSHMDFLKPMAKFHLPFSSDTETMVRVLSLFLLKEFIKNKDNKDKVAIDMTQLEAKYNNVNEVNKGILKRIRSIAKKDANANALVILDSFSEILKVEMSQNFTEIAEILSID